MSRKILPLLLNGHAGISPETFAPPCPARTCQMCDFYFGAPRQAGGSHRIYKTPWQGDPRVNIQDDHGMAKPYQVRQVLKAIERLEADRDASE